jgi:hypothetical protein
MLKNETTAGCQVKKYAVLGIRGFESKSSGKHGFRVKGSSFINNRETFLYWSHVNTQHDEIHYSTFPKKTQAYLALILNKK